MGYLLLGVGDGVLVVEIVMGSTVVVSASVVGSVVSG